MPYTCNLPSGATTTCYSTYSSTTAITQINGALSDTGSLLTVIIFGVVAGTVALMALGYAIRHIRHWISGRRF